MNNDEVTLTLTHAELSLLNRGLFTLLRLGHRRFTMHPEEGTAITDLGQKITSAMQSLTGVVFNDQDC
jgi:hypothetical protein